MKKYRNTRLTIRALSAAIAIPVLPFQALANDAASDLGAFLTGGELKLNFRYRYENVDDDVSMLDEAHASTLKTRLNYTTKVWNKFSVQVEVDDVSVIGNDNYNDGRNGKVGRSKVLDFNGTEINQAWIAYSGFKDTTIKHGRQTIKLDNLRFVSALGWRQNTHSYSATALINKSLPDAVLFYAHITDIHHGVTDSRIGTSTHVYNASYSGLPWAKLSAYRYELGGFSDTTGVLVSGSSELGTIKTHYEVEWATQEENDKSKDSYDADYLKVVLGASFSGVTAKVGQETLEGDSDNGKAFYTPLGLNHAFNGWADKFAGGTPVEGLVDKFVELKTNISGYKLTVAYHQFESDESSDAGNFGDEVNIAIAKKISKNVNALLKHANYSADDFSVDTHKTWLQVTAAF